MYELNPFGKKTKLHHIGIAVKSIKKINPSGKITIDNTQKVKVSFLTLNGVKIELLEPYGNRSPIIDSLKKNIKLLHICYTVPNIEYALKESRKFGFHCISKPVLAKTFKKKIAWVYSNEYGLFELLEYK